MAEKSIKDALYNNWGGSVTETDVPWYAIRLFCNHQRDVANMLKDAGLTYFVPMEYREVVTNEKHFHRVLMPVVRNLIFIAKDRSAKEIQRLLTEIPYKLSVIRRSKESMEYSEIPHSQMIEFQIMCNPEIELKKFLTEEQAKLKPGEPVRVKYGPLKGLTGRLVRSSKKYYLLKEIPGIGVMIKVSRWCCTPL